MAILKESNINKYTITKEKPIDIEPKEATNLLNNYMVYDEMTTIYLINRALSNRNSKIILLNSPITRNFTNTEFLSILFRRLIDIDIESFYIFCNRYNRKHLINLLYNIKLDNRYREVLESALCEMRLTTESSEETI